MEGSDTGTAAASLVPAAEAVTGSLGAPAEGETPGLREPDFAANWLGLLFAHGQFSIKD